MNWLSSIKTLRKETEQPSVKKFNIKPRTADDFSSKFYDSERNPTDAWFYIGLQQLNLQLLPDRIKSGCYLCDNFFWQGNVA